ncbi:MAG: hypothetical protein L0Z50_28115 [Verrucomicrobiales bacterium]|nr:hypothetical protein [Verrucomicrobiales bacterium]
MGNYAQAEDALVSVDEAGRKTASYHKTAAALARSLNLVSAAETHFSEATRLEPDNPVSQLNLASIRLLSTNLAQVDEARLALSSLMTNPTVRCDALRHLALDAMRSRKTDEALKLTMELQQCNNAVFGDRILELKILEHAKSDVLKSKLATLQDESKENPQRVFELTKWMISVSKAREALDFIKTLEPTIQTNQPVPLVAVDCYVAEKDWAGLDEMLREQDWNEMEFFRLVLRARALKGQSQEMSAKSLWVKSLRTAENRRERLVQLVRTTAAWDWPDETEQGLWAIANRYPDQKWAYASLYKMFYAAGKTRSLQSLLTRFSELDPTNTLAKSNLAMTLFLLNPRDKRPGELAREAYEAQPKDPFIVSTYAYSLHLQEKTAEALKVFSTLKPEELETPSIAAWYGIVLAASGEVVEAKKYLDLAEKIKLLPEEMALVRQARAGI